MPGSRAAGPAHQPENRSGGARNLLSVSPIRRPDATPRRAQPQTADAGLAGPASPCPQTQARHPSPPGSKKTRPSRINGLSPDRRRRPAKVPQRGNRAPRVAATPEDILLASERARPLPPPPASNQPPHRLRWNKAWCLPVLCTLSTSPDNASTWSRPARAVDNCLNSKRMRALPFEWDPGKERANRRKHRVAFAEASAVFGDPLSITIPDPDHGAQGGALRHYRQVQQPKAPGSGSYYKRRADAIDRCSRRDKE